MFSSSIQTLELKSQFLRAYQSALDIANHLYCRHLVATLKLE